MFLVVVTNKFFVGNQMVEVQKPITEGVAIPAQPTPAAAPIQTTPAPEAAPSGETTPAETAPKTE
jgi:hypothetical protein